MPGVTIFQCLPAYKARPTHRIISDVEKLNCRILLDLEDSINDITSPARSAVLKQRARIDLEELFRLNPGKKFDIRINAPHSGEYENDMYLVNKYSRNVKSVFIPKVEDISDIDTVLHDARENIQVNPIIESLSAIKNSEQICSPLLKDKIEFFFFGNYDFHLDAGIFPIHEQHSESYWRLVEPLIHMAEKNFRFGNSPYAGIDDLATLQYIMFRLNKCCKRNYAVVSLHKKQTIEYGKLQTGYAIQKTSPLPHDVEIVDTYKTGKLRNRSFAFDRKTNRIITPQEYLLAINHLAK